MGYFSCCGRRSALRICDSPTDLDSSSNATAKKTQHRHHQEQEKKNEGSRRWDGEKGSGHPPPRPPPPPPPPRIFRYDELAAATCNFHPSALLGRGSHGSVFLAALDGGRLLAAAKTTSPDAVRYLTRDPSSNEIEILSSVRRSSFLVNLLGYTDRHHHHRHRITVVELMPNGSLHHHLHSPDQPPLPWPHRVRLALQAGEAILTLHSLDPPVIHRDIKSSNVLIDGGGNARLGDFGLAVRARTGSDDRARSTPPAGTMGYLDPGYVAPADLSAKSDVFSFGILLLEILSGREAIDVDYSPPSLVDWAAPLIGIGGFDEMWDPRIGRPGNRRYAAMRDLLVLAERCVGAKAETRPGMGEVVEAIRAADARVSSPVRDGLVKRMMGRRNTLRNMKVSDVAT